MASPWTKLLVVGAGYNFSGSVGQVERAFHTEIHKYLVNGELHHANSNAPSIPRALSGLIVGFASLHDSSAPLSGLPMRTSTRSHSAAA
jgi:subtilase family serine protease